MALRERLVRQILETGPLTVAQYMTACLHDPQSGYYATRPTLGESGDFITAPLVSQMFGELIGVWTAAAWSLMGEPLEVRVVELGPGDGTLISDVLRAARTAPPFLDAVDLWLVETSPPLQAAQRKAVGDRARWAATLADVPEGAPVLLVANELLDCLPARQFVRTAVGWAERLVAVDPGGSLAFHLNPTPAAGLLPDAPEGAVYEQSAAQAALGAEIGARLVSDGGAALLIDYGHAEPGFGDTLQALSRHRKVDPLATPGEADLTVHADFPSVMAAARKAGAEAAILSQAEFLARMGIGARAEALVKSRPGRTGLIGRQLDRLVSADQMGALFKVCCLHAPGFTPPAFEDA